MKRLVVCCDGTWQRLASPFPTNIERIAQQMWFIGDHGCVGGLDLAKTPLSNIALRWMKSRMQELGLGLLLDFSAQPDQLAVDEWLDFEPDDQFIYQLMGKTNRVINPKPTQSTRRR